MSNAKQDASAANTTETTELTSILEDAIKATKATSRDRTTELVKTLVSEAMQGTVTYGRDVARSVKAAIDAIDAKITRQLAAIMHHEKFQTLEGSWRGLHYLVMNTETSPNLKLRVQNVTKRELYKDLEKASEFDQSNTFEKLYTDSFGTAGGEPFGAIIGNYEFTNHPDDIILLRKMSGVAAAGFCPFLSAAAPQLLSLESFADLKVPRDLATTFDTLEYTDWKSYRDSEDSRFVVLTMPRVLARLPYGQNTKPIDEFKFQECELDAAGKDKPMQHNQYTWMNAAFVLGTKLTHAFATTGFCTKIRGAENGGKVEELPAHIFTSMDGDTDLKCPTEIGIPERREHELSKMGFLPLCHYQNTNYAVFFGAQTTQKPKKYDRDNATANAAISARLPYIMACSRFAHYLKVIGRDKVGSFLEAKDCQEWLHRWIMNYVCADPNPTADQKAKLPLAEARVEVKELPGKPGEYDAVFHLRPWLQMETLTAAMSMVARIPAPKT